MTTLLYMPTGSSSSYIVTETTISNLLFLPPHSQRWITPLLEPSAPFLPGLVRQELLATGMVTEATVTLENVIQWSATGLRVACCNALRGIWEVELVWADGMKV